MLNWFYSIGKWTWIFCETWYGELIWNAWLMLNVVCYAINIFYPLSIAYAGGTGKDLKWNPILVMVIQIIIFIVILWVGSLFYK